MITYSEIETESLKMGVSVQTVEKDYHLDWYLTALWSNRLFPQVLFYGGTAIKKIYVFNHRFSEDIDFVSEGSLSPETIGQALDQAHRFLEKEANLFYFYRSDETRIEGTQTRFVIHYRGFSEIGGIKHFLLDFAQGIEGLPKPVTKKFKSIYRDLAGREVKAQAMPVEVICAEKLALIVDRKRKEPRDIYDLWAVFMQVKNFDSPQFMARYQKRLGYPTEFSIVKSFLKDSEFRSAWEVRLRHQVPGLPDFEVVHLELTEKLKQLW